MRLITLITGTCLALTLNAQWSLDAANPMVVCEAANNQWRMHALSDGGTGWYAFWTDMRTSTTHGSLYGQHFDASGNALWTPNGKLIFDLPGRSVNESAPVRLANGDVMLAVLSAASGVYNSDTVRAIRVDSNGDPVWAQPTLLSVNGPGIFGNCFYFSDPKGINSGDGAYFCYHGDSQGSNGYYVMQRVNGDGTAAFTVPGIAVPFNAGWGPHSIHPDGANGMYVAWRCGNGAGACHRAVRVDNTGAPLWADAATISDGGPGLSYAYTTINDGTGSMISAWEQVGGDIAMARFDNTGAFLWSPSPLFACNESHEQATPALTMNDGSLFVAWSDNRPPANNRDLYVQKFDLATGAPQWTADGVATIQTNSYIPTARIVPSTNGSVIGIMDMSGPEKYCAMRLNGDGTMAWAQPASFATANLPAYDLRTELPDADGGVVTFWMSSNYDLYAAKLFPDGSLGDHTAVQERTSEDFRAYPNPAMEALTVSWNKEFGNASITVLTADGRVAASWPASANHGGRILDVSSLATGCYVIRLDLRNTSLVQRFFKR